MRALKILMDSVCLANWGIFMIMIFGMISIEYGLITAVILFMAGVYILKYKRDTTNIINYCFWGLGIVFTSLIAYAYFESSDQIQSKLNLAFPVIVGVCFFIALWLNKEKGRRPYNSPYSGPNYNYSSSNSGQKTPSTPFNSAYDYSFLNYEKKTPDAPYKSSLDTYYEEKEKAEVAKNKRIQELDSEINWGDFHHYDESDLTRHSHQSNKEERERLRGW